MEKWIRHKIYLTVNDDNPLIGRSSLKTSFDASVNDAFIIQGSAVVNIVKSIGFSDTRRQLLLKASI